jgi:hypothetical protein
MGSALSVVFLDRSMVSSRAAAEAKKRLRVRPFSYHLAT